MKLEAGKKYKTESGEVWCVDYVGREHASAHNARCEVMVFSLSGLCYAFPSSNLISEWTEPPAVGSYKWANSLPVGTKVRWNTWLDGQYALRTADGWARSQKHLICPGTAIGPGLDEQGWLLYTEPKLRPWRPDEVPLGAWITMEGKAGRYLITGAKEFDIIVSGIGAISYEHAFNRCKRSTDNGATWLQCGVADV